MLKFHRTSIMTSNAQTVVNTVNTVGVVGKGIAAEFKKRYPEMFVQYKTICNENKLKPGSLWLWKGPEQWVLNFSTKKHWRNPSKIEYIKSGLAEFVSKFEDMGIREIAFPRLGCGNGGLNWDDVQPIMVHYLRDLPITVYIHDYEKKIGNLEHKELSNNEIPPQSFEAFNSDIRALLQTNERRVESIIKNISICANIGGNNFDYLENERGEILADDEDLFRIWSLLLKTPVAKLDLPDTPYENALSVFSILSNLPYIRLINLAGSKGRPRVAIEMARMKIAHSVSDVGGISGQGEFLWE